MHTYRKNINGYEVGHYAPVTWSNALFGPRTVHEWKAITVVRTEEEAQILVAKLNGKSCYDAR